MALSNYSSRIAEVHTLEAHDVLSDADIAQTTNTYVWWHRRRPAALLKLGRNGDVRFSALWQADTRSLRTRLRVANWHGYWRFRENVAPGYSADLELAFRYCWGWSGQPTPVLVNHTAIFDRRDDVYRVREFPVVLMLREHPALNALDPERPLALPDAERPLVQAPDTAHDVEDPIRAIQLEQMFLNWHPL